MRIIRIGFQENGTGCARLVVVVDMKGCTVQSSAAIPGIVEKMEAALPGVFPDDNSPFLHTCGGQGTGIVEHSFREEVERGTDIAHLLEHVLLHLLSRRSKCCSAFCGRRSVDLAEGIDTHYYLMLEYSSKLEALGAVVVASELVRAWVEGREVGFDPMEVLERVSVMSLTLDQLVA